MTDPRRTRLGATFPLNNGGPWSNADLRGWIDAVTRAGFDYVSIGDHTLGTDPAALTPEARARWLEAYPGAVGDAYRINDVFREPLMLGAYFAAVSDIDIATGVVPLPQRQTVLFAKQAAELDRLCNGRLRLGIGTGWNALEFEALGVDFGRRQSVLEEQLLLLRRLWTESTVTFEGDFHAIHGSGIQVLPLQRPIPVWLGGDGPRTLDRIGRLADGWHPAGRVRPGKHAAHCLSEIRRAAVAAGRDPADIGLEVRLFTVGRSASDIREHRRAWEQHRPDLFCVHATSYQSANTLETSIAELRRVADVLLG